MSYWEEFNTVDAVLSCNSPTIGVDAFALTLIKAERQMRKLFTFLIFQMPCFGFADVMRLREILAKSNRSYFRHFIGGWDGIYKKAVRDLVGKDYDVLLGRIEDAIQYRNKIFHGQLPAQYLPTSELLGCVTDIRSWCSTLATNANQEIGYDGFGRNSFRKAGAPGILDKLKITFHEFDDYERFVAHQLK